MLKFIPTDFHRDANVDEFSDVLAIKAAELAQAKFDAWLSQQKRVYSTCKNNTLWMRWEEHTKPTGYDHGAYLIPIKEEK